MTTDTTDTNLTHGYYSEKEILTRYKERMTNVLVGHGYDPSDTARLWDSDCRSEMAEVTEQLRLDWSEHARIRDGKPRQRTFGRDDGTLDIETVETEAKSYLLTQESSVEIETVEVPLPQAMPSAIVTSPNRLGVRLPTGDGCKAQCRDAAQELRTCRLAGRHDGHKWWNKQGATLNWTNG
jgi:hypothetical protein